MRYAQVRQFDVANGIGIRVSVFVTGCTHKCPECFNELYQDFAYGEEWTEDTTQQVIDYLRNPVVTGLTLLGGEPMQNLELAEIMRKVRANVPKSKNFWVYSGYTYEQIISHPGRLALLRQCDVLVDGLFEVEKLNLKLRFRGSENQRVIDIKRSFECGEIVLYPLEGDLYQAPSMLQQLPRLKSLG